MLKFNMEGNVHLILKEKDKIIKELKQKNLFLLNGRKRCLWGIGNGTNSYIILSSSVADPVITDTVIPNVYGSTGAASKPSYLISYNELTITKRLHQQFSPPSSSTRHINTVGLSHNSDGSNALCFTKLLSTVEQTTSTTVDVYYSLTFSPYV